MSMLDSLCMAIDYDVKPLNNNSWTKLKDDEVKSVAIIGAGATGLAALRVFTEGPANFQVTVFERSDKVGGLWNYDDNNGGPMYDSLKTNLCVQGMMFPGHPFPFVTSHAYPTHREMARYLHMFAESINAHDFIRFRTSVISVEPVRGAINNQSEWIVRSKDADSNEKEERFHAVLVCNGHFDAPYEPVIPGLKEHFGGRVLHCRYYDRPEEFANQSVLVLGAANSGQDIAVEVASTARHVYLSHNGQKLEAEVPANLSQVSGLLSCEAQGLRLRDGSLISPPPDVVMFATGYNFTLDRFLASSCGIRAESGRIFPLYKNLVNSNHPSMFLLGLLNDVAQFPMYHCQALAARAALEGRWRLPSGPEMLRQSEADFARAIRVYGKPRHVHLMRDEQWAYNAELLENAGYDSAGLPICIKEVFNACWYLRRKYLCSFRELSVIVSRENGHVAVVPDRSDLQITEEDWEAMRALDEGRSKHPAAVSRAAVITSTKEVKEEETEHKSVHRKRGCSGSSETRERILRRSFSSFGSFPV